MRSTMMTAIDPVIVLNELLDEELNSPIRYIETSMPYVEPELSHLREPLKQMLTAGQQRVVELISQIQALDGEPVAYRSQAEEQYLAFLSLKFLLPMLIEWKTKAIHLHERALTLDIDSPLREMITRHLQLHQRELGALSQK